MNRVLQNRLILQLLFTVTAAMALAGIGVLLITDAVRNAEGVVVSEARNVITAAVSELREQQPSAGITRSVLRSYSGVEGGFYKDGQFVGYAYPTHDTGGPKTDVPSAERGIIAMVAQQSLSNHQPVYRVIRGRFDVVVIGAVSNSNHTTAAWAMKRIHVQDGNHRQEALLAILIAAALASVAGSLTTGMSLTRGIAQIRTGLSTLETDFEFRLPERRDELGRISQSINRMAAGRRKLETDLRREDRLRALGRLAAGLAHEIRNPLNSIRLTVQLLEHRLDTGRLRREDLATLRAEVDRLSALLNDLLDLQRSRPPAPEFQPVLPIVHHCVRLLERQSGMQGAHIRIESPAEEVFAVFDTQQLTQTVMNLLLNALEAVRPRGTINISIAEESGAAKIAVQDDGPGLDSEQEEHLFEPFYTSKPSGTGLGLAVSRELMRRQGGDVVYGGSQQGARFTVRLPRSVCTDQPY
jgi:signal transduction histidine kinase